MGLSRSGPLIFLDPDLTTFFAHRFTLLVKLGLTVVATIFVCVLPFLSLDQLAQIVHRVFPVARGLYEDKVANIWCAISIVVKLRSIFSQNALAILR